VITSAGHATAEEATLVLDEDRFRTALLDSSELNGICALLRRLGVAVSAFPID
jgi:hypothetical protein